MNYYAETLSEDFEPGEVLTEMYEEGKTRQENWRRFL
ncbi:MAG: hypothetical protein ACOC44_08830 [Promethearchaeia archaeon]